MASSCVVWTCRVKPTDTQRQALAEWGSLIIADPGNSTRSPDPDGILNVVTQAAGTMDPAGVVLDPGCWPDRHLNALGTLCTLVLIPNLRDCEWLGLWERYAPSFHAWLPWVPQANAQPFWQSFVDARERYAQARAIANRYAKEADQALQALHRHARTCIDATVRVTVRRYYTARAREVVVRAHPRDETKLNVFPGKATIQDTGEGSVVVWIDPEPDVWTMVVRPIKRLHGVKVVWSSGRTVNDIEVYHLREGSRWREKRRLDIWTLCSGDAVRCA